jgi:hypothetical protein
MPHGVRHVAWLQAIQERTSPKVRDMPWFRRYLKDRIPYEEEVLREQLASAKQAFSTNTGHGAAFQNGFVQALHHVEMLTRINDQEEREL